MSVTDVIILTSAALLLGIVGASAFWLLRSADQRRMAERDHRIAELEKRAGLMDEAAQRGRVHHTYNDLAAIDQIIMLAINEYLVKQEEAKASDGRLQTIIAIGQKLREGPGK